MKILINTLDIVCRRDTVMVPFSDFTYFYGEIGSGKSTIARLVDFCFGGTLVETPALQSEFVEATLRLQIGDQEVALTREKGSNQVQADWGQGDDAQVAVVPARVANGVCIPDTQVEVLSDFLFHVAGHRPPRVRKSKQRENSDLVRLSFRDFLWYCYLDQDEIDSSFFYLDRDADYNKRAKSRDVLRTLVGMYQVRVAELEDELEAVRRDRQRAEDAARALKGALSEVGMATEEEIISRLEEAQRGRRGTSRRGFGYPGRFGY